MAGALAMVGRQQIRARVGDRVGSKLVLVLNRLGYGLETTLDTH